MTPRARSKPEFMIPRTEKDSWAFLSIKLGISPRHASLGSLLKHKYIYLWLLGSEFEFLLEVGRSLNLLLLEPGRSLSSRFSRAEKHLFFFSLYLTEHLISTCFRDIPPQA